MKLARLRIHNNTEPDMSFMTDLLLGRKTRLDPIRKRPRQYEPPDITVMGWTRPALREAIQAHLAPLLVSDIGLAVHYDAERPEIVVQVHFDPSQREPFDSLKWLRLDRKLRDLMKLEETSYQLLTEAHILWEDLCSAS